MTTTNADGSRLDPQSNTPDSVEVSESREVATTVETPSGELTALQDAFVDEYVTSGGDRKNSVIRAGYSENGADVTAVRLLKHDVVIAEIFRRSRLRLVNVVPKALAGLQELAMNARSERVRREALDSLLDRAGFRAPERIEHHHGGGLEVSIDLS